VVTNGFSCATQIAQAGVGREALHLAQVMQLARWRAAAGATAGRPEDHAAGRPPAPRSVQAARWAGLGAAAAGAALAGGLAARRR
jgi:hypothetical protein